MKIGIFDSGLGGLIITKAISDRLPTYDTIYYGDTLNVPYGSRSPEAVLNHTQAAMDVLFAQECQLIVMACNTANASSLQKLQQTYLPRTYPDRRILGVVIPTLETAHERQYTRIGVLATQSLVSSKVYEEELHKINPKIQVFSQSCPLLVPLIENDGLKWIDPILQEYLEPLLQNNVEAIILGCTHYPLLKTHIQKFLEKTSIELISQDEIIPDKLADYLVRHPEIEGSLSQEGRHEFFVSDLTDAYSKTAHYIYGQDVPLSLISSSL